jgi:hypothetical protein
MQGSKLRRRSSSIGLIEGARLLIEHLCGTCTPHTQTTATAAHVSTQQHRHTQSRISPRMETSPDNQSATSALSAQAAQLCTCLHQSHHMRHTLACWYVLA